MGVMDLLLRIVGFVSIMSSTYGLLVRTKPPRSTPVRYQVFEWFDLWVFVYVDIGFNGGGGEVRYLAEGRGGGYAVGVDRMVGWWYIGYERASSTVLGSEWVL